MPTQIDTLSYMNNVSANTLVDLYSFESPWNISSVFGVKTKITFYDGNLLRLEAEHYVSLWCQQASSPNYPGYIVTLYPTPEGSRFTDNGYEQIWEYELDVSPLDYYGHLQYPDNANIYNYFNFIIKLESTNTGGYDPDANLKLTFSINSPNLNGTLLTKSEILHAI